MTRELLALLLAGTLMIPLVTSARGDDRTGGVAALRPYPSHESAWKALSLPAVPHLDTMPWLNLGSAAKGLKVDMLFGPKLDTLGPFLLQPALPHPQVSSFKQGPEVATE
jgi:hypothetical protein